MLEAKRSQLLKHNQDTEEVDQQIVAQEGTSALIQMIASGSALPVMDPDPFVSVDISVGDTQSSTDEKEKEEDSISVSINLDVYEPLPDFTPTVSRITEHMFFDAEIERACYTSLGLIHTHTPPVA